MALFNVGAVGDKPMDTRGIVGINDQLEEEVSVPPLTMRRALKSFSVSLSLMGVHWTGRLER